MRKCMVLCAVGAVWIAAEAQAAITIDVRASSAPNFFGSPSWGGYLSNALTSLENNSGNIGNRTTDPTAYEIAGPIIQPGDIMVSSFNSWRGTLNPAAPFNNELGNRLHFGLHAFGDGTMQFRLEEVSFEITSSDSGNVLGFAGNFVGFNFSSTRFGVDWGADRAKGGGDDTVYSSGNGTTLVDEIVYVGVGNALWPGGSDPNPSNPIGGAQAAIDNTRAFISANDPYIVSGKYTIGQSSGTTSVRVIPAPGAAFLAIVGVGITSRLRRQPGRA